MSQENHKAELLAYLVIGIIGVFLFFGFVQETEYNSNLRVEVDRTAFNRLSVMNDLSENPERIPDDINLDRCQFSYTINEDQEDRVLAGCSFENRTKPIEVYMHIPGKLTNVSENCLKKPLEDFPVLMDEKACSNIEIKRSFYVPERGNTYVEVLYNEPQDIRTNLINAEVERVFSEDNTNMKLFASWDYKNYKGRVVEPNEFVLQLVKPKSYSFESKTMSEKSEYRLAPTGDDMLTWKMDKEGLPSSVSFSMYRNRILDKVPATLVGLLFGFVIHGLLRLSKDYLMKLSEKYGFSFSRDSFF